MDDVREEIMAEMDKNQELQSEMLSEMVETLRGYEDRLVAMEDEGNAMEDLLDGSGPLHDGASDGASLGYGLDAASDGASLVRIALPLSCTCHTVLLAVCSALFHPPSAWTTTTSLKACGGGFPWASGSAMSFHCSRPLGSSSLILREEPRRCPEVINDLPVLLALFCITSGSADGAAR